MKTRFKKIELAITIIALLALAAVWAINGYDDTWLYVAAGIIVIPSAWFLIGHKKGDE